MKNINLKKVLDFIFQFLEIADYTVFFLLLVFGVSLNTLAFYQILAVACGIIAACYMYKYSSVKKRNEVTDNGKNSLEKIN